MSKETFLDLDSIRENVSLCRFICTSDECQILLMALGELLGSVQREEQLVPTIRSLIRRVEDAQNFHERGHL